MSAISTGVLLSTVGGYDEGFLALAEFGLFATAPAFGCRELHAFTGPGPDEVGFEFCDHRKDVELQPVDRARGIMNGSTDIELAAEVFGLDSATLTVPVGEQHRYAVYGRQWPHEVPMMGRGMAWGNG